MPSSLTPLNLRHSGDVPDKHRGAEGRKGAVPWGDDEPLDAGDIAELTDDSIRRMNRHEMARVVRAVKAQHLRPGVAESLTNYAPEMLRRLVFLTRRWCRDQQGFRPQSVHDKTHSCRGVWST